MKMDSLIAESTKEQVMSVIVKGINDKGSIDKFIEYCIDENYDSILVFMYNYYDLPDMLKNKIGQMINLSDQEDYKNLSELVTKLK